jgi:hypothetical protein
MNKAPSQGLFHFAVLHQQVLHVGFPLDPCLHHPVQRTFCLYLVNEHGARVAGLMLPDGAYRFPWFS